MSRLQMSCAIAWWILHRTSAVFEMHVLFLGRTFLRWLSCDVSAVYISSLPSLLDDSSHAESSHKHYESSRSRLLSWSLVIMVPLIMMAFVCQHSLSAVCLECFVSWLFCLFCFISVGLFTLPWPRLSKLFHTHPPYWTTAWTATENYPINLLVDSAMRHLTCFQDLWRYPKSLHDSWQYDPMYLRTYCRFDIADYLHGLLQTLPVRYGM